MSHLVRLALVALLATAAMATGIPAVAPVQAGATQTYIVLYQATAVPADARAAVERAGGVLVAGYDAIGVAIARSANAGFRDSLLRDSRVEGVAATAGFGVKLSDDIRAVAAGERAIGPLPNAPANGAAEPLAGLQWDMRQIKAPQAQAITGGSRGVVVGILDTGIDYTHPDLAPNIDFGRSVSCESGVPNQSPAAWDDENGHGTHTAGTVGAAVNGIGIAGVAPNVRLAAVRSSNADGFFFPEMVVCAFMWVAEHGIDVTNNSYFADPWLFNCRNDAGQRAIWKAEQRAIRYAMARGVTVVASGGNDNYDLAHPTIDVISPDFPPGSEIEREITNACLVVPAEIPGVITVTANGNLGQKAYYSSYGVGVVEVTAPGGDRRFQLTAEAPNGRVLSSYPSKFFNPASPLMVRDPAVPGATYAYLQGTSMAAPHVAGVAALVISRYGRPSPRGQLAPGAVAARITQTADPVACPPNPFNPGPPFSFLAICQGGEGNNSFYGKGQVNALRAIGG